jgi:hypothetical protein
VPVYHLHNGKPSVIRRDEPFSHWLYKPLKKQFRDDFQGIHKFLEPCDDGSWHVHYIACFRDVPETFEKWAKRWWARKQGYDSPKQVEVRAISSQADLEATIRYLNPCSAKKEHRIPHYPKNCQCMRGYGDYAMPTIAIYEYDVAKKIVGHEDPTKRKNIRVIDADTNVELYYRIEYHFTGFIISHCQKQHYDISANKLKVPEPIPVQKSLLQSMWKDADCAERNTAL